MLRAERPRMATAKNGPERTQLDSRQLLLAVAPPPQAHSFALSGWPDWLVPTYRSGGHRIEVHLLEEKH
jgi:hypothetical protein